MSQRSKCWPDPTDPEHLFAKVLLTHGPIPPKGWRVTRAADGRASYIVAGSRETGTFVRKVCLVMADEVSVAYAHRGWRPSHRYRIGQMWKNKFMLWVWEEVDASNTGD